MRAYSQAATFGWLVAQMPKYKGAATTRKNGAARITAPDNTARTSIAQTQILDTEDIVPVNMKGHTRPKQLSV